MQDGTGREEGCSCPLNLMKQEQALLASLAMCDPVP